MFWQSFILILVLFHIAYVVGQIIKNNAIVDPLWGLGFVVVAWFTIYRAEVISLNHIIVTLLVTIWGVRLAWHIIKRNRGKPEDWRYAAWRKKWGAWTPLVAYFQVYLLQALLQFVIVLPVIYVNTHDVSTLGFYTLSLGLCIWLVGYFFESVGDQQLAAFLSFPSNRGKVMDQGLWRFTRHPNYFGEATMWWGIWIIVMGSLPFPWWAVLSPVTITFLLLKVSGVPLLEKKMLKDKAYQEYAAKTSKFIPRRPKG